MNHQPDQITFTGRKPSRAQILAKVKPLAARSTFIEVYWGENWLQLDKHGHQWHGHGWLKDIDADSIARELNQANSREFIREHFQFITIGA